MAEQSRFSPDTFTAKVQQELKDLEPVELWSSDSQGLWGLACRAQQHSPANDIRQSAP